MSLASMELVWNNSRAVGTARVVLLAIADHDGDNGAWPSIATLARHANVNERSVQRAISTLVELGELVVHTNAGGTHRTAADRRPNLYEITLRPVDKSARRHLHGVTHVSPRGVDGVTSTVERGDVSVANGVTPASPEPSLNRPEPSPGREAGVVTRYPQAVSVLRDRWKAIPDLPQGYGRTLSADQVEVVEQLLEVHGVDRLLAVAVAVMHDDPRPPRGIRGFVHHWEDLTPTTARRIDEPFDSDAYVPCGRCGALKARHHHDPEDPHDWQRERVA